MTVTTTVRRVGTDRPLPTNMLHYIGGDSVASVDGATISIDDPVTHQHEVDPAAGGPGDVDRSVWVWR